MKAFAEQKGICYWSPMVWGVTWLEKVASQMAAEIVNREYFQHSENIEKSFIAGRFQMANRQIFDEARLHDTFRGMGTTCTAIVVHDQQLYFAHVGDSRAYLFKAGQLIQLTQDHTYIQELLRKGGYHTRSPQPVIQRRNVLTQAMGHKKPIFESIWGRVYSSVRYG